MTFILLRRDASEVRWLNICGLCHEHAKARDHLLVEPPDSSGGVGLCKRCGNAVANLIHRFGGNLSMTIEPPMVRAPG
jgi:hypothetical protein